MIIRKTDAIIRHLFIFIESSYFLFSKKTQSFYLGNDHLKTNTPKHSILTLQITHIMNAKFKFLVVITVLISVEESYTFQSNRNIVGNKNEIKSQDKVDINGVSGVLEQIQKAITDQMTENFLMALSGLIFGVVSFIMVTVIIIYACLNKKVGNEDRKQ